MAATTTQGTTLHSVHALRFFAAFAVLVHHSLTAWGPPLTDVQLGAAGVDVFFVISGVVIGYADHDDGAYGFVVKRVVRVIPLYWIATLVFSVVRYLQFADLPTWENVVRSLFLVPDFAHRWFPIYYPAWTLCFEVSFYGLFALLLPWLGRGTTLAAAIVTATVAILPVPVPFVPGATFNTPQCLEFAMGLLIAEALSRGFRMPPIAGALAFSLGIAAFAIRHHDSYDLRVLHWGVPSALVVFGAIGLERGAIWRNRQLVLGGSASYAIYLFHVTAMEPLLRVLEGAGLDLHSRIRFVVLREVILLSAGVGAGVLAHLVIERPLLPALRRMLLPARRAYRPARQA
jgi:exopolysaccharide production protein ExoZ